MPALCDGKSKYNAGSHVTSAAIRWCGLEQVMSDTLEQRFHKLVDAFNNQDSPAVNTLLDDKIVLKTLNSPQQTLTGRTAVLAYLGNKFTQVPPPFFKVLKANADSARGRVNGPALWSDHDTDGRHLAYIFTFVLHSNDHQWYAAELRGTPA
jgi:hypothetical protein